MREICDRCLVSPFEKGEPRVTWANTHLPLPERLEQLTAMKPWQLKLAKGKEVLDMTVPPGVAIRDKPARSARAEVAETEQSDEAETEGGKSTLAEAVLAAERPWDKAEKVRKATGDVHAREEGVDADVQTPMDDEVSTNLESKSPSGTDSGDVAAPEDDNVDPIAELAAAGLMAVAAGEEVPKKQKIGRGQPRRVMTQEESEAAGGLGQMGYDKTNARGGLAGTPFPPTHAIPINPALLAAYEAGRANAAATYAMHSGMARGVPPPDHDPVTGPSQMPIADILGKFYNYKPSGDGPDAYPLTSFGNLGTTTREYLGGAPGANPSGAARYSNARGPSVPRGVPLGVGSDWFAGGSHADNVALWQWRHKVLAALSGRAEHPAPGVFAVDTNYTSLFAPHVTADQMREVRLANERAFAELAREVDACASIARLNRDEEKPRAALCVRVENALHRVTEKRQVLGVGDKTKLAAGVLELQTWVKAQLQLRIEELTARAWEKESDARRSKGKAPVDTGVFAALATVAAASELQHKVPGV